MYILDRNPVILIKYLQYGPSLGKFPTNLEHLQETFVKPEILNCGLVLGCRL